MAMTFSPGDVLEHVQLNNMVLAADGNGVYDGLAVSQRGAGANMSVDVASGNAYIAGVKYNEASTVNLAISASHATLHRKDLITYDSTTSNPVVTQGANHAGGDSDPIHPPDIPAGDILLAIVDVDAAVTIIGNDDIHDTRITIVGSSMPAGMIMLWHGTLANIPLGWVLCDGTDSTPDLRDKFVRGAADAQDPGTTSGSDTHTHTTPSAGAHSHSSEAASSTKSVDYNQDGVTTLVNLSTHTHVINWGGNHSHTTDDGSTVPAYYAIAYIMKT